MMSRIAIGILLCAAAAWGQALQIDCGQSVPLAFSPGANRYNLAFNGQGGETVLFRLLQVSGDRFFLNPPTVVDAFGNSISARASRLIWSCSTASGGRRTVPPVTLP